jgi:hypothetical protein
MKTKLIVNGNIKMFEQKVQDFINQNEIISIHYSEGKSTYSVLIIYK